MWTPCGYCEQLLPAGDSDEALDERAEHYRHAEGMAWPEAYFHARKMTRLLNKDLTILKAK